MRGGDCSCRAISANSTREPLSVDAGRSQPPNFSFFGGAVTSGGRGGKETRRSG